MSTLLDLSITLTPPLAGSPPEAIASITLRCDPQSLTHSGDLLSDPLTKEERESLRWYLEEYWQWPYEQFLTRGKQVEALLPEIGKRLYGSVFGSVGAMKVLQPWRLQPGAARQLSIVSDNCFGRLYCGDTDSWSSSTGHLVRSLDDEYAKHTFFQLGQTSKAEEARAVAASGNCRPT